MRVYIMKNIQETLEEAAIKYKLIEKYPMHSYIPDNAIVTYNEKLEVYVYNNGERIFSKVEVERYPKFWEKVIPKDYEILSFIRDESSHNYKGVVFTKNENNTYDPSFKYSGLTLEHCLSGGFDIHSVKRLSDGEVFTVGQKVTSYLQAKIFHTGFITKINIREDGSVLITIDNGISRTCIQTIKPYKNLYAHRYNTICRCCEVKKLFEQFKNKQL